MTPPTPAMHESPRCGAQTRKGAPCRAPAVRDKRRCRLHGGAPGSGGQPGNANAFKHGNKNDPDKVVTLECRIDGSTIELHVEDEGAGFDPDSVPDPTELENLEIPSGRGIVLMRSFMSEVSFEPPGNRVRLVFTRPADDTAAAG